jgi:signal transduction histidine kinase
MLNLKHMLLSIQSIVDYSLSQTGNIHIEASDVDISQLSKEILQIYSEQTRSKNIFTKVLPERKKIIWKTDKKQLESVISTIIFNSVKYTLSGKINVSIEESANREELRIIVEDTGVGMDPEQLAILKESLSNTLTSATTSNCSGVGLGLRIASTLLKYIAPKDNNKLVFSSTKNRGTRVEFV